MVPVANDPLDQGWPMKDVSVTKMEDSKEGWPMKEEWMVVGWLGKEDSIAVGRPMEDDSMVAVADGSLPLKELDTLGSVDREIIENDPVVVAVAEGTHT